MLIPLASPSLRHQVDALRRATACRLLACAALLAATTLSYAVVGYAQSLELSGKLGAALVEAQGAYENLSKLQEAARNALAGGRVSAGSDWSTLADKYERAAQAVQQAPLPSEFQSKNIVSASDLMNCATHADSMEKLRAYLDDLQRARDQGSTSLTSLNQRLTEIPKAGEALTYLTNVHQQLVSLPIWGEKFAFDALDLEHRVSPALNGLEAALKDRRDKVAKDLAKMDREISNYRSNLDQLSKLECSSFAGMDNLMLGTWDTRGEKHNQTGPGIKRTVGVIVFDSKNGPSSYRGRGTMTSTFTVPPGWEIRDDRCPKGATVCTYSDTFEESWTVLSPTRVRENDGDHECALTNNTIRCSAPGFTFVLTKRP